MGPGESQGEKPLGVVQRPRPGRIRIVEEGRRGQRG